MSNVQLTWRLYYIFNCSGMFPVLECRDVQSCFFTQNVPHTRQKWSSLTVKTTRGTSRYCNIPLVRASRNADLLLYLFILYTVNADSNMKRITQLSDGVMLYLPTPHQNTLSILLEWTVKWSSTSWQRDTYECWGAKENPTCWPLMP